MGGARKLYRPVVASFFKDDTLSIFSTVDFFLSLFLHFYYLQLFKWSFSGLIHYWDSGAVLRKWPVPSERGENYTNCSYWVHLTKASCWAGNVEELPKHPAPISSLLFNGFTPIPYDGVYCSTRTPLPPPLSLKHTSHSRSKESKGERIWEEAMGKNKHKCKRGLSNHTA